MPSRWVLIVVAALAFLTISFELARYLSAAGAERSAVIALLRDAVRGDARAATARLASCTGACARSVEATVQRVRRPGVLRVLQFDGAGGTLAGTRTAPARVAWATDVARGGRAVVQCVTVRRSWSFASGASVTLLRLSAPIPPQNGC